MADFTLEDAMQVRVTHLSGTCPCAAAPPSLHSFPILQTLKWFVPLQLDCMNRPRSLQCYPISVMALQVRARVDSELQRVLLLIQQCARRLAYGVADL